MQPNVLASESDDNNAVRSVANDPTRPHKIRIYKN